jgi:protein O-mannosyl-transferase
MFKSDENRRFWLVCLILIFGTLAVYGRLIGYDFAGYDDEVYVTANSHVQHGPFLKQLVWAFTTSEGGNWHPLTWLSHILDCRLYGLRAGGHHVTNLLFHLANTILLFRLLCVMTGAVWRSGVVAALFAWHPMHVESVAWIAERKDVLSTFFGLLAIIGYLRYALELNTRESESKPHERQNQKCKAFYLASVCCYLLALLCKPMLVTLPFILMLLDYWPLCRASHLIERRLLLEKSPYFILTGVFSAIALKTQSSGGVVTLATVSLAQRIANTIVSYGRYLQKMIWPSNLCVFYPYRHEWPIWLVIVSAAFLLLITATVIKARRTRPWAAVGWLWYLGTLVPVIGLVQVGMQSMADRYSYIPLIGIFIMLVWEVAERVDWAHTLQRAACVGLGFAVLAACLTVTWFQVSNWRDVITLFTHAVSVTTNNYVAQVNLGVALYHADKSDEAISHFNIAMELRPDSPLPAYNLGRCYEQKGDLPRALSWFEAALRTKPDFGPGRYDFARLLAKLGRFDEAIAQYHECLRYTRDPAVVYFGLGNALAAEGRLEEAATQYRQSLDIDSYSPDAQNNLGAVMVRCGDPAGAVEHFKAALALQPNFPEAEDQLGGALQKLGQIEEARRHFAEAVRLNPGMAHAQLKLGLLLAQQGRFDEATNHLATATHLEPTNDVAWFNLAGAYAAKDHLEDAAVAYARELQLKPEDVEAHVRLGAVLLRAGKSEAAISEYERAAALTKDHDLLVLGVLEEAYAAAGRFQEAIKTAQQIEELATSLNQPGLAEQAARRIALYREGKRPSDNSNAKP